MTDRVSPAIKSYTDVIKFPPLLENPGSLTAMEKSLLAHFILLARPSVIVELGVFQSLTTQFMCELLIENEIPGRVIGFDLPEVVAELRQNNEAVRQLEAKERLQLVPGRLPNSLQSWLINAPGKVDFALVDATHDYRSVSGELSLLWTRLPASGYILCHDYSAKYDGVRVAVDQFSANVGAMCLPLLASEAAGRSGHWSVLVALARRPDRLTIRRMIPHWWMATKTNLLSNQFFAGIWKRVKPIVR